MHAEPHAPSDRVEPKPDERPDPEVIVHEGAEEALSEIAVTSLRGRQGWYERAGEIVEARVGEEGGYIRPVPYERFYTVLSGRLRWSRWHYDKKSKDFILKPIAAPVPIARSAFAAGAWPLPPLVGVRDTPILRPDGRLVQKPGYDDATRCVYAPRQQFGHVNPRAGEREAKAAMARLVELFCDFIYEKPEMVSVPISAILAVLGRDAIQGAVPLHAFTAPQPGTGKGLHLDVISQITEGQAMIPFHLPMPKDGDFFESGIEEDQEKRLAGAAMGGARALYIDNTKNGGRFGGPVVDKYLTAPGKVRARPLGSSDHRVIPWFTVLLLSGNGVRIENDTRRRTVEAAVVPPCAKPSQRDQRGFRFPLSMGHALRHRPQFVSDALTIMVAHANAGRPRFDRVDHANYEAYQSIVCDAMAFAGAPQPSSCFLSDEEGLSGDDQLVALFMRILAKLGAYPGGSEPDGVPITPILERLWSDDWVASHRERNAAPPEEAVIVDAREAFRLAWRLPETKRPSAKMLSPKLAPLCGRVLVGADVWPSDDASGLQQGEWRASVWVDGKSKAPRYAIANPRHK